MPFKRTPKNILMTIKALKIIKGIKKSKAHGCSLLTAFTILVQSSKVLKRNKVKAELLKLPNSSGAVL